MDSLASELKSVVLHPSKFHFQDYHPQLFLAAFCCAQSAVWSFRTRRISPILGGIGLSGYLFHNASILHSRERMYQKAYIPPAVVGYIMCTAGINAFRQGLWPKLFIALGLLESGWHSQRWFLVRDKKRAWGERRDVSHVWDGEGEIWTHRGPEEGWGRPPMERWKE